MGRLDVEPRPDSPSLRATIDAPNALMRAVPRVCHREKSRSEASSEEQTPATQGQREMSCTLQHGVDRSRSLDPVRSSINPARLSALYSVSERSPAGLSRLQHGLHHEKEVPSGGGERKRSRSRVPFTNVQRFDPQSGPVGCRVEVDPSIAVTNTRRLQRALARCTTGLSPWGEQA